MIKIITEKQKKLLKNFCEKNNGVKYVIGLMILKIILETSRIKNRDIAKELGLHEVTISRYSKIVDDCIKLEEIRAKEIIKEK